jgi:ABC-2 type transport system permease protein
MFVMAIAAPLIFSFVISLVFGTLFNDTPSIGIVDEGDSQLFSIATEYHSMNTIQYRTEAELKQAVESGTIDVGMVLPSQFDSAIKQGQEINITGYIWGESRMEDLGIIEINIFNMLQQLAGQEAPVNLETITLSESASIPWNDRLLPIIVLMAVIFAAVIQPAMAVVIEKEIKTLSAVAATPATLGEIFLSKGVIGAVLSLIMGVVILLINNAFGSHSLLLVLVLALGAIMGSVIGLLIGVFIRNIDSLLAFTKVSGILLYAPALVYMFPGIPQWIGRIFPTYYIIAPIVELTQRGGGWSDIALDVFILIGLIVLLIVILSLALHRKLEQQLAF